MKAPLITLGLLGLANVAWGKPPVKPPPDLIPGKGAVVARNSKLWVIGESSNVQLFDSQGIVVLVTASVIDLPLSQAVVKLTPQTQLVPGQYEVRANEYPLSTFTVIDELDSSPPSAPSADVVATGRVGQVPSAVTVSAAADADSFLVVLEEGRTWEPESALAAGARGVATVFDLPAGQTRLKVIRVDAAGNASEPAEVLAAVPADRACSVAPVMPLSLLALALFKRRRHKAH